jgi:hypothetical protein
MLYSSEFSVFSQFSALSRGRCRVSAVVPIFFGLLAFADSSNAVGMQRIAQFGNRLDNNFPCGDANHNGRNEVFGAPAPLAESLIVFECRDRKYFERINAGFIPSSGDIWAYGDGDRDSLMELVGMPQGGTAVIYESSAPDRFPTDSVWGVRPVPGVVGFTRPLYTDLDQDGRSELTLNVGGHGIWLFENSGDNQYESAAVLVDNPPSPLATYGDFDVGDLDRDGKLELMTGKSSHWLCVYEATGSDNQYELTMKESTDTEENYHVAFANDMDHNYWPEFVVLGRWMHGGGDSMKLMVYEAFGPNQYHRVWEQFRSDFDPFGWHNISVGDVDGDGTEEFCVANGYGVVLYKSNGPASYEQVWSYDTCNAFVRLFDINSDGRAEVIFDSGDSCNIWEDTSGLGIAEFARLSVRTTAAIQPTIARLGMPVVLSDIEPDAAVEIHAVDGRLVCRRPQVRQPNWTWNLRDQAGNLVPAGTYFAAIRSRERLASLKLCIVK